MPRHAFRFQFRLDVIQRIEIFHFARDPTLELAGIKKSDRPDSASAGQKRFPKFLQADSVRRQNPHSGNDDAISFIMVFAIPDWGIDR